MVFVFLSVTGSLEVETKLNAVEPKSANFRKAIYDIFTRTAIGTPTFDFNQRLEDKRKDTGTSVVITNEQRKTLNNNFCVKKRLRQ